jgi:hypothetical protein
MSKPEPVRPAFIGWHRLEPPLPWRRDVEAESEPEAWRLLLGAVEGGDQAVHPSSRDTNRIEVRPKDRRGER